MKKIFICIGLALALSACSTQRFDLDGHHATIPTYEGTSHFVFWGIGQEKDYNPREICSNRGVSAIDTHHSFLDGLLGGITWGIYAPESYAIYCK
jgi:hypothetical protein